jgi:hypothetical protein
VDLGKWRHQRNSRAVGEAAQQGDAASWEFAKFIAGIIAQEFPDAAAAYAFLNRVDFALCERYAFADAEREYLTGLTGGGGES